jgi:hypothetical protein
MSGVAAPRLQALLQRTLAAAPTYPEVEVTHPALLAPSCRLAPKTAPALNPVVSVPTSKPGRRRGATRS